MKVEAIAVSDNPLVFAAEGDIISGSNFHAEPVAMAADNLALAIAEIGSLTERRISLMMDKEMSQRPPFLVKLGDRAELQRADNLHRHGVGWLQDCLPKGI